MGGGRVVTRQKFVIQADFALRFVRDAYVARAVPIGDKPGLFRNDASISICGHVPGAIGRGQFGPGDHFRACIAGDFDDSALLKTFGAEGEGFFAAHSAIAADLEATYKVKRIGSADGLVERVFAISTERKLVHPAVLAILKSAKEEVFV